MRAVPTGSVLFREIEDACSAGRTECHGKDPDETLYAPFRLDIELPVADRTDGIVILGHLTRASLKIKPRHSWL
jgi:hypothetical protein